MWFRMDVASPTKKAEAESSDSSDTEWQPLSIVAGINVCQVLPYSYTIPILDREIYIFGDIILVLAGATFQWGEY